MKTEKLTQAFDILFQMITERQIATDRSKAVKANKARDHLRKALCYLGVVHLGYEDYYIENGIDGEAKERFMKRMKVLTDIEAQTEDTIDQYVEDIDFDDLIIIATEWNCDTGILQLPGDMWPDAEAELRAEVMDTWYDIKREAEVMTEGGQDDN